MPAIAVLAAAAAAWCFLQVESRHPDALAGGAGPHNGNFLDNDQWLSTVSQYDRDKYWNRFRDVSTAAAARPCGAREPLREGASGAGWSGDWCRPAPAACRSGFLGCLLPEKNFKDNFEGLMLFACDLWSRCVLSWDWGR